MPHSRLGRVSSGSKERRVMPGPLIPQRDFGSTGVRVPLIGYGTAPLGKLDKVPQPEGVRCLNYPFDTVLSALGMADHLVTAPDAFLLPKAVEKKTGVIAMKVFGHGEFQDREFALRYTLGLPGVSVAILGMDSIKHVDDNVTLAA